MRFEVTVSGDEELLDSLCTSLTENWLRLKKDGQAWVMTSSRLECAADLSGVQPIAEELCRMLTGAACRIFGIAEPIRIVSLAEVKEGGARSRMMPLTADAGIQSVPPGKEPAEVIARWLRVANDDPDVAHALMLFCAGDSWANLYAVYEIIKKSSGGKEGIAKKGWADKDEANRFSGTANSRAVLGVEARHGVNNADPLVNPMNLSEASSFIASLFDKWVDVRAEMVAAQRRESTI